MRKLLLVLTLLFTIASFGQKQKATLYFRDGTILDGLAKITPFNDIKFRENKNSKKNTYDSKLVYKLILEEKGRSTEYHYKIVFERLNPILLAVLLKGRLAVYRETQVNYDGSTSPILYITKDDSDLAHILGYTGFSDNSSLFKPDYNDLSNYGSKSNKFKKEILTYIEDCPDLVDKIKNDLYKRKSIDEVINFYNENCGGKLEESTNTEIKD
ncbi:MAG: hypothetical protein QM478_11185 [Flavobacteriaceae bacterium]